MSSSKLTPCGIYRTRSAIGDAIPAGRLVYFHNHGDPGPGVYLPAKWVHNRAEFSDRGTTLPAPAEQSVSALEQLPAEGFYRVTKKFFCCEKKCRAFEPDELVQLGYTGAAEAIVFTPELTSSGMTLPDSGSVVALKELANLAPLKVAEREPSQEKTANTLH